MSGLMLNEDATHFYSSRPPEKISREGAYELVDHYISPQMKELVFNVNDSRVNFPSKVWQTKWDGLDFTRGFDQPRLAKLPAEEREKIFKVFEKLMNVDLPQCWIERVRQHGRSPWLSIRMNDCHYADQIDNPFHSDFWRSHSEYWRIPDPNRFTTGFERCLDYGRREVREYYMSLIKEVFDRYDFDGLELDWMRHPFHFRPGFEEEGRKILIDFHREVRCLADSHAKLRGHPIKIGVRVPSRPWTARAMGLDAVAWAGEKLIDLIVITPFWATAEFDMPVEMWKELLGPSPVILAGGLEVLLRSSPKSWPKYGDNITNSAQTVFGAAASLLHRGADRIYLFNYMDDVTTVDNPADYPCILNNAGEPATAASGTRRHVVTYSDTWAPGEPEALALPAKCVSKGPARFRIHIGPKPQSGTSQVYVGLGEGGNPDTGPLEVYVNEVKCSPSKQPLPNPIHSVVQKAKGFEIPAGTLHDGYNYVEISSSSGQPHEVFWVEITIRPV
jgi:hypothetical protein